MALSGEVEDYRVDIVSAMPWQNDADPLDVNNDGVVVPLDALLIINELNGRTAGDPVTGLLPNPPVAPDLPETVGYVDVDGDGYASPRDALLVINLLNSPPWAAVAAEGESVSDTLADTSSIAVLDDTTNVQILAGAALMAEPESPRDDESSVSTDAVDEVLTLAAAPVELTEYHLAPRQAGQPSIDLDVNAGDSEEWIDDLAAELAASLGSKT